MQPKNDLTPQEAADLRALEKMAEALEPDAAFASRLESKLRAQHHPARRFAIGRADLFRYAGLAAGLMLLAVFLNWLIGSLAPTHVPAAGGTPMPAPIGTATMQADVPPQGDAYEWRGTTLTLNAVLPSEPAQALVSQVSAETPATLESILALAAQFGLQGHAYETPGEIQGTSGITISDGKARLYVRSDQYYTYWPDYPAFLSTAARFPVQDAEAQIAAFLSAHGMDFAYRVQPSEFYGGYYALPLADDGIATRYDYFKYSGLLFRFNAAGITAVEASLVHTQPVGTYGIVPAKAALDLVLAMDVPGGMLEGVHSGNSAFDAWYREYPMDADVTIYARPGLFRSLDGSDPLVTLDGYPVPGAGSVAADFASANLIRAVGQFTLQDGIKVFRVQSWEVFTGEEFASIGTLQMQGDQAVLLTQEGQTLKMPDLPADVTLPLENVYVMGVLEDNTVQWSSFDLRMTGGGGGGGGGGMGLYQLNLSGTPIPFPTATPVVTAIPAGSGYPYTVVAGDTIKSIAAAFGIPADELMTFNGLTDPGTLYVGQTILIPEAQTVDGWQGLLNITHYQSADGTTRTEYSLVRDGGAGTYLLQAENFSNLDDYQNRPIQVWGTARGVDATGRILLQVERTEIPYPDLKFTIIQGRLSNQTINGEQLTLLEVPGAQIFVVLMPDGTPNTYPVDPGSADVLVENLGIPGETYAGYPALRVFSSSLATNPKTGVTTVMPITADAPYTVLEEGAPDTPEIPSAVIESVELVYFTPDLRYKPPAAGEVHYVQPMWLFRGHYSNGDEFEILIQALQQQYLSPELEPIEPPG